MVQGFLGGWMRAFRAGVSGWAVLPRYDVWGFLCMLEDFFDLWSWGFSSDAEPGVILPPRHPRPVVVEVATYSLLHTLPQYNTLHSRMFGSRVIERRIN